MTSTYAMTELYTQVQHFYARQMQALDTGRFEEYAGTFTEDGSFQHTPTVPPAVTRPGIVAELRSFNTKYAGDPVRRRHWFNQIVLDPRPDGAIDSTVYAMIVRIRPGERPEIWPHCLLHDVLVEQEGEILMRSRVVTYDEQR
ncbi:MULTISPECIES: nuclear transport factor 2 family protein [unclassified Streptomyces]|uniref:nuclear transport factor 2 family protein n=1 Tax=unclassified Streptomyces TaxID=2593676 RepID=UPI002E286D7D|nr:nuclear transport factor 2 family protein [Streptomyces sp. NBC_01429]